MKSAVTGTLYVVATPIGNLEDITLRALRILKEVQLIAAEDTRRTRNLLRHYEIGTPLISLHEHNERQRQAELLRRLGAGSSIALVSDAGTPAISDPGAALVRAARESGVRVEPIPGPSAVTAALSGAGVASDRFAFAGFPPIRSKDRKLWWGWLAGLTDTPVILFEAPHRLEKTLTELGRYLGNRPIILARELTKLHEEWLTGTSADLIQRLPEPRGEFVIVIEPVKTHIGATTNVTDADVAALFGQITEEKGPRKRREAIRLVAGRLALTPKEVFAALERHKTSVNRLKVAPE